MFEGSGASALNERIQVYKYTSKQVNMWARACAFTCLPVYINRGEHGCY